MKIDYLFREIATVYSTRNLNLVNSNIEQIMSLFKYLLSQIQLLYSILYFVVFILYNDC